MKDAPNLASNSAPNPARLFTGLFTGFFTSLFSVVLLASVVLGAPPARAATPQLIGAYTDWNAFAYEEKGGKVCYMAGSPRKAEGKYSGRGDIYLLITRRKAEKSTGVISVIAGYVYKKDSQATVTIGGKTFKLFTDGDKAWARDNKGDKDMVRTMKRGLKMVVKGTSGRGTATTDTYSLTGFSAAYYAIGKACGVK